MDWVGALLVTAGLTCIVFILSDGSIAPDGWKTSCKFDLAIFVLQLSMKSCRHHRAADCGCVLARALRPMGALPREHSRERGRSTAPALVDAATTYACLDLGTREGEARSHRHDRVPRVGLV